MAYRSLLFRCFVFGSVVVCGTMLMLWPDSAQAQGVSRSWAGGGATADWFDPQNWTPAGSPSGGDILLINNFGLVGLNTNNVAIGGGGRIDIVTNAMVTLNLLFIGPNSEGTLGMIDGTLTTDSVTIGAGDTSFGTANISGSSPVWNITDSAGSDLFVGDNGEGRLNITGGAVVNVADDGFIGNQNSGTGVVDVSGSGSTLSFTDDLDVGSNGNGTLNIANSAVVSNDNPTIGNGAGSVGKVTIDSAGTWTNTGGMIIGLSGTGTLEIRGGGSATSTGVGVIGNSSSGVGRVLVDGSGSLWHLDSFLDVGFGGTGQMEISGGGRVENTLALIGPLAGSDGSVIVRGSGSIWDNSSSLQVGDAGTGTLLITDGGTVENTDAEIGNQAGSTGTVTVEGIGSTWTNTSTLDVGVDGDGTLNIAGGATVSNTTGTIAGSSGSTGAVVVIGSTWTNTSTLDVGVDGDGTLNIAGGATVSNTFGTIAGSSGSTGAVVVTGGDTHWNNSFALVVGFAGAGTLNITGGGHVSSASGTVGLVNTVSSTATIDGAGSKWTTTSGSLVVGGTVGTGTLNITNAGVVDVSSSVTLGGVFSSSTGTATVSGAGSRLDVGTSLTVSNVGTGALTVADGGAVDVTQGTTIGANGTLTLDGGTLTTTSLDNSSGGTFAFNSGTVTVDGGAFDPGPGDFSLNGSSTATLNLQGSASSTINGVVNVGTTGDAVLNLTDGHNLSTGDAVTIGAFGEVNLDGGTLSADDFTNTSGGTFNFTGGTLSATGIVTHTGGLTIPTGGTLTGSSTVNTVVNGLPGSTITATGGMSLGDGSFLGFVHQGALNAGTNNVTLNSAGFAQLGALTTIAGGTLTAANGVVLGAGDNLDGFGTVNAPVAAGFGSTINNSGGLTLGDSTSPIGFASDGVLHVGPTLVTINDSNLAELGALTTLGVPGFGGVLDVANGAIIDFAGNLTGEGTVQSPNDSTKPIINNGSVAGVGPGQEIIFDGYVKGVGTFADVVFNGTFSPGLSPAAIDAGSLAFGAASELEIELGGLAPGSSYDQINSDGTVALDGTLDVLLLGGFTPSLGDMFEIITATSVLDTFTIENLPDLGALAWNVNYSATNVVLEVVADADFDNDGDVDGRDFLLIQRNNPALIPQWETEYGTGVGAVSSPTTAVPEPSSIVLFAVFATIACLRKAAGA